MSLKYLAESITSSSRSVVCLTTAANLLSVVVQSLSYVQLCNRMDCSAVGSSVLHYILEFAQIHVH